ncbi:MAG: YgeY family selenium metabolism-linked hydrolase [Spirochaetia bacterium]|nr:YgeY family selenium metabolism-linked hydrolase [Spirochaetia bacterium]
MTQEELVNFTREIIRIPSLTGEEKNVSEYIYSYMKNIGFPEVFKDLYNSVIGVIPGKSSKTIVLDGHIDTVGVGDEKAWTYPPYSGSVVDGKLYGRGTTDMKGAVAAMIFAAAGFLEGDVPQYTIAVTATASEETYEGYACEKALEELSRRGYESELVIIGEASSLNLMTGQRGRAEIAIDTYGVPAHSAHPEMGINAVESMAKVLQIMNTFSVVENKKLGKGISTVTDIISFPYPGASVIPTRCALTVDRRTVVGEDEESVLAPYKQFFEEQKKNKETFLGEVRIVSRELVRSDEKKESVKQFHPAWSLSENNPLVLHGLNALKNEGFDTVLGTYAFCTNGSGSAGRKGITTVGFGPSRESLAHVTDEYIELTELHQARNGYIILIEAFSDYLYSEEQT